MTQCYDIRTVSFYASLYHEFMKNKERYVLNRLDLLHTKDEQGRDCIRIYVMSSIPILVDTVHISFDETVHTAFMKWLEKDC